MTNMDRFIEEYRKALAHIVATEPGEFAWPASELETVLERMEKAFRARTFNHDGKGIRRACKALGIKTTRTAILAYMETP